MAIPFQPPEWLLQEYMNRKSPGEQVLAGAQQAASTYMGYKTQQAKLQQDKLDGYIKAFGEGGPGLATDYAKRVGLQNPPSIPALTKTMAGPGGTAGVMTPPGQPQAPAIEPTMPAPDQGPAQSFPWEAPAPEPQMSMNPLPAGNHVIDHWNNTMGAPAQPPVTAGMPAPVAPAPKSPAIPAQAPQRPGVAGIEDNPEQYLNMGSFGLKKLQGGEALGKYREAMTNADEKRLENSPRSANQLRQDFVLAGQGAKADDWIQAHAPGALDSPDEPLVNVAKVKEAKDWLGTGAMNQRGSYFETMGNLKTQDFRDKLIKEAKVTLDPMFQTGEGRAQGQRLNSIGRTEPLITQMLSQKGGGDARQMRELATRVDAILKGSPGGQSAVEGINALVPETARGKFAGWLEWFNSNPQGTEQQAFIHRYADTIGREKVSVQNQVRQTMARTSDSLRVLKSNFPDDYNAFVTPYLNGSHVELTGEKVPTIANDADFKALPPGTQFRDPDGQLHTKR